MKKIKEKFVKLSDFLNINKPKKPVVKEDKKIQEEKKTDELKWIR